LVTGSGEKVVQIPINPTSMRFMPGIDRFAHTLESFKVSPGIPVTEAMIGNHRNPGFEELGQIREVHQQICLAHFFFPQAKITSAARGF
jgi:hypothetical protein